jgi:hypothetical protein
MLVKWRKDVAPASLLAQVEAARSVGSAGNVSYANLHFEEVAFVLAGAVDFGASLPAYDRQILVTKALFAPVAKGTRIEETFLPSLKGELGRYWRQPVRRLFVATAISLRFANDGPSFQIGGAMQISFPRKFTRTLGAARITILKEQTSFAQDELPSGYRPVLVKFQRGPFKKPWIERSMASISSAAFGTSS